MPDSPGSMYCPVASYKKYICHLNPECDRLLQKLLDSFEMECDVWYANMPIGEKKLGVFMSDLSKKCKLSLSYKNHSIHATGATVLTRNMYGSAQIMAVSGHKSVQSLTTYQRVDTDDKIRMGKTISENLLKDPVVKQKTLPSMASLTLPFTDRANIPAATVIQDFVPVNNNNKQIIHVVHDNSTSREGFMDYLQDIDRYFMEMLQ
ncbi:unnamed protein product [Mytilus coruscus]|uniref:Tyr recombinase domain-containing protein n=1 Tax=Mytilus coruscus TaxID=42192 RepID=A0A6J8DVK5_MYTCO|nr:unnamed protein product [Mytilus coruscus]